MLKQLIALGFPSLLVAQFSNVHEGFGLDIGSNGSGIFFSRHYTHESGKYSLSGELRFYDIKASDETIVYDWYYNQYQSVGGKSLLLVPFFLGSNYYPFAGKIANNFSPFINIKFGPIFILDGAENGSFKQKWYDKVEYYRSWGGFFGIGADIINSNNTILTVRVGYDELPMPQKIDGRNKYSGALVRFGFNWKK